MSTKSRVRKLEKSFAQIEVAKGWLPPGWNLDDEIDRAEAELETIAKLIVDKNKTKLIIQYLENRLIELVDTVRMPADRDEYKKSVYPRSVAIPV